MNTAEPFQLGCARGGDGDIRPSGHGVAYRLAHEDLAAACLSCHAGGHGHIPAEEVVAAAYRAAQMDSDADAHTGHGTGDSADGALHLQAAAHGLLGVTEGDHEAVPLALHDMPAVCGDAPADQPVVPAEQGDPRAVAQSFVERGGTLDIGERDHDITPGGEPRQIGPFDLGPSGQVLDRTEYCRT